MATVHGVAELDTTERLTDRYIHVIYNRYICIHAVTLQAREKGAQKLFSVFHLNSVTHQLNIYAVCCFLRTAVKWERSSLFPPSRGLTSQSPRDPHGLSSARPSEMRV